MFPVKTAPAFLISENRQKKKIRVQLVLSTGCRIIPQKNPAALLTPIEKGLIFGVTF